MFGIYLSTQVDGNPVLVEVMLFSIRIPYDRIPIAEHDLIPVSVLLGKF